MFGNVAPTPYDLRFSLLGVPVRVHPLFWLIAVVLGLGLPTEQLPFWILAVFVSILVHEMGHALAIRSCGWEPSIVLYMFGGLAMYQPTHRSPGKQIMISLAGPAAGFLLAAAILAVARARHLPIESRYHVLFTVRGIQSASLYYLVSFLLEVNILWGLMNLLPVFPLDGGQALRELLVLLDVRQALIASLWVSVYTGAAVAVLALARLHDIYLALLFGSLAYSSFATLQAYHGGGGGYGRWS